MSAQAKTTVHDIRVIDNLVDSPDDFEYDADILVVLTRAGTYDVSRPAWTTAGRVTVETGSLSEAMQQAAEWMLQ